MPENIDPAIGGKWEIEPKKFKWLPVHTALLYTGKVLGFGGSGNDDCREGKPYPAEIWDPVTHEIKTINQDLPGDLFCCGHSQLANGQIMVAGGKYKYDKPKENRLFSGLEQSYVFDPSSETWMRLPDMKPGRWYPTLVTLGDGRVVCLAGLTKKAPWFFLEEIEIYSPESGWTVLDRANKFLPLYPRLHLLPNGEVIYANAYNTHYTWPFSLHAFPTSILNVEKQKWRKIGVPDEIVREEGATVLLPFEPPDYETRILLIGGGTPTGKHATNMVEMLAPLSNNPMWMPVSDMTKSRYYNYSVILPNKKVLVVGGRSGSKGHARLKSPECKRNVLPKHMEHSVMEAEWYDSQRDEWTTLAAMEIDRQYHASAHLLPDGRVATFGSNPARRIEERRIEMFSPPYLFQGPRPVITASPESASYGEGFTLESPEANDIDEMCLIRFGASTHCTNTDQRYVGLSFSPESETSNVVNTSIPSNSNLLPPGYYMLFVLVKGVPSVAKIMKIGT